jgi:hypothetical protein
MTDWGPLVSYVTLRSDEGWLDSHPNDDDRGFFYIDEAYLSLGPLLLGYTQSVFDVQGGGYTDSGLDLSDYTVNEAVLNWSFNGFGVAIGVEDGTQARYGSLSSNTPTIAAALTTEFSGFEAGLSFLYSPNDNDDTMGVEGVISTELGIWQFQLGGLWVDGYGIENDVTDGFSGDGWELAFSSKQNWQKNFYTAETVTWQDFDNQFGDWGAAFTVGYSPVDNLWFLADAYTVDEGDNWGFRVFAKRTFGADY